jgi:arylsulfatase A-like enzyme
VEGGPVRFVPKLMTHDQVREVNAMTHIQNELRRGAAGHQASRTAAGSDTDIFFTTDHGELQGDFGLLFKGPYHCDALMHLPMIWRPAPSANVAPADVADAVGQVDLAPTFCEIAGVPAAAWMQGKPLPKVAGGGHERMITEWDSQFPGIGMHLRTIYRDGFTCTVYEPSTPGAPTGLETAMPNMRTRPIDTVCNGSEGEPYNHAEDPHQWRNPGAIRNTARSATTSSPTCTTTCRPRAARSCSSKHRRNARWPSSAHR